MQYNLYKPKAETRRIVVGYWLRVGGDYQLPIAIVDLISRMHGGFPCFPVTPPTTDEEAEEEANRVINKWLYSDD